VSQFDEEEPSGVFDTAFELDELSPEQRARIIAGRYEIVERLGSGAMGQVLGVRHIRLGRSFALKVMHAELSLDKNAEQLFHREARLASQLSHPNIIEMIDFGNDPDWGWFIVMEYLEGEPLSKRIDRLGKLPITAACEIAAQLADALAHSHSKQVIHADLKSENVLCLNEEGERTQVKLLDFGMAQLSSSTGISDRVAGTPEYLAPERITGSPPQASSDIYALGVILYDMLCGSPPFVGGDPELILHRQLAETPEPVSARRGEQLDARLEAIVDKALAKDPAQRYPSADVMHDELRAYLDLLGVRRRAATAPSVPVTPRGTARDEAAAAAFDALRLPSAGLHRDGTIVIANAALARLLGHDAPASLEGKNIRRTLIGELNRDIHDDLRLVALSGKVVRRHLDLPRGDKPPVRVRYLMAPASGACGHCMLVLHSA
jgi:eukaryotic-like serine/threonine-protein kinase